MATTRRVSFLGLPFIVNGDVLAPRAETELLAKVAIERIRDHPAPLVIDMCCGSGNLGVALAREAPRAKVWACDLTDAAVRAARQNVVLHGLNRRIRVVQSDMFAALPAAGLSAGADLIVCNPPYISTARLEGDRAHLLLAEPREAFDGGAYGISILQRLVREGADQLRPGGWLAFEFGEGQARQARLLLQRSGAYEAVEFFNGNAGQERVALAQRRAEP